METSTKTVSKEYTLDFHRKLLAFPYNGSELKKQAVSLIIPYSYQFWQGALIASKLFIHGMLMPTSVAIDAHYSGPFLRHSLRSPLTTIMINLETSLINEMDAKKNLKRALMATRYLTQLLQPTTSNRFKPATKVIQVATFLTAPQAGRYVNVISKIPDDLTIQGDAILFQEIISCLITNGFEAYRDHTIQMVIVSLWKENSHLSLTITDFGTGMTWLTKKLSLTKGFSNKKNNTGYGLWFVEKCVHVDFKGKLSIGSQTEVGTSIKLEFPLRV